MADINAQIGADISELRKDLNQATGEIKKWGRKQESAAKSTGLNIRDGLKVGFGFIGIQAATDAVRGFFSQIQEGLKDLDAQQAAQDKLLNGLGGQVEVQERLIAQARQLQGLTLIDDTDINQQQAYLAQLGFTEDQIASLIPVAADLAAGLGQSLDFAVKNLAKTTGGLTGELGELVPELKNLTAEQLRSGEAVRWAAQQFDGAAEANRGALGPLKEWELLWGDIRQELAENILPLINQLANWLLALPWNAVIDGIRETIEWFKVLGTGIGAVIDIMAFDFASGNAKLVQALSEASVLWQQGARDVGAYKQEMIDLLNVQGQFQSDPTGGIVDNRGPAPQQVGSISAVADRGINELPVVEQMLEFVEATRTANDELVSLGDVAGNAFSQVTNQISNGVNAFAAFAGAALDAARQIVNAFLAQAIAGAIAGEAKKGLIGLALAGVAVAGIKALFNKEVPKLAIGTDRVQSDGLAYLHRGEAVVPADVASGGFTGGGGSDSATITKIQFNGKDFIWSLNQAQNVYNRTV